MRNECTMPRPLTHSNREEETMRNKIQALVSASILAAAICVSAFAGDIPTIPVAPPPPGGVTQSAEPTPTPTPEQSAAAGEQSTLDWLLGILFGG